MVDLSYQTQSQQQGFVGVGSNLITSLLSQGVISQEDFAKAKMMSVSQNKSVEQVLMETGKLSEDILYKAKADASGYKYVDLSGVQISIEVLNRLRKDIAEKYMAIPFEENESSVSLAISDPDDLQKVRFLQTFVGKPVEVFLASPSQIKTIIDRQYGAQIGQEVEEALEDVGDIVELSGSSTDSQDITKENLDSAPVSRIVNMILEYAVKYKASDIHIEPREKKVVVRLRISGVLLEKLTLPRKLAAPVVSRIKILSNLKIDEHRLPQDGRFQIKVGNAFFDIRVAIMPCVFGEKVVLRLLERGGGEMRLEDSGLRGYGLRVFQEALKRTEGIILVTGPTGSGKTHTLASSLKILNTPEVNIQTLEDPVEIRVEGVTQVQVNTQIGLTFAAGLRSFLRQDPDIIMVGEIRDAETANLAIQASLTGHLVLATLHTNSAAGGMPRLLDMGVESYLISSTVNVILAQRLARKICPHCRQAYRASEDEVAHLHKVLDGLRGFDLYAYPPRRDEKGQVIPNDNSKKEINLFKGGGCQSCNGTGYAGRIGIFEALSVSEKIGQLIMQHRSSYEIEKQAVEDGMVTMIQDGFLKTLEGVTTLAEVLRVVN